MLMGRCWLLLAEGHGRHPHEIRDGQHRTLIGRKDASTAEAHVSAMRSRLARVV